MLERIKVLQEEIESSEGRLKYLNDQIAWSSLQLNITQKKEFKHKASHKDSFWERSKEAAENGYTALLAFITGIISLWPLWLIVALVLIAFKYLIKKRKAKKSRNNS